MFEVRSILGTKPTWRQWPKAALSSQTSLSPTDGLRLWTFAGSRANAMLASAARSAGAFPRIVDNFGITVRATDEPRLVAALDHITEEDCEPAIDRRILSELKFGSCLPEKIAESVLRARLSDFAALREYLRRPRRWIRE
jgi:ATP-dependent helicase Lhr and Lhr-like helicase